MNLNQNKCLNSNTASNMTAKVAKPIKMAANRPSSKAPVRHKSNNAYFQNQSDLVSSDKGDNCIESKQCRLGYIRAPSCPLGYYMYSLGPKGDPCRIPRKSDNNDNTVSKEMERRNKMIENWRMNGLSKPVATSDSADIKRNTSRIENKHLGVKQSRSLDLKERRFDGNSRNVQSDVKDRVRKHHASEKIRRSTSSKYKNEGMESKQGHHKANVYRSDKEHPDNLHFIDAFDFSGEQNTRVNKEEKQPRKTTLNDSHKGSEDSSLSKKSRSNSNRMSDVSRTSKVVRQDSTGELKRHKELVRRSSASPETNSNELQSPKRRKSSAKRKEIHKMQPTFYGLSGKDLALPLSTSEIRVKSDKRKIPQRNIGTGIITSNFTVLETGEGIDNGDRRDGSLFQRKNCCLLLLLSVICLILAGVVTALLIIFMSAGDSSDSKKFDMLRAHVRLRIINRDYTTNMDNHSDISFTSVATPFCQQVDYLFLTSKLHSEYFGCVTKQLSSGSVKLYYVTPFLNSDQAQNVTNIKHVLSGTDGGSKRANKDNTVYLGNFLVDVNSINIVLESYQIDNLPKRPRLILNGLDPTSAAPASVSAAISTSRTSIETTSAVPQSPTSDDTTSVLKPSRSSTIENIVSTTRSSTVVSQSATRSSIVVSQSATHSSTVVSQSATHSSTAVSQSTSAMTPRSSLTTSNAVLASSSSTHSTGATSDLTSKAPLTTTETWSPSPTTDDFAYFYEDWTTTEDVILPSIEMTGAEVHLNDNPAKLRCIVKGLTAHSGQIGIYYKKTTEAETKTILTLVNKGLVYSTIYRNTVDNLVINHTTQDYIVTIDLNFTKVECTDVGYYTCELRSQGNQYADTGYLKGFSLPEKPQLLIPSSLIEGQELLQPITCTSHVGYPPGNLRFMIKPRGHTTFFPLQDGTLQTSGTCGTNKTISLMYTPTKDANGTLLKCVVDNKQVPHAHAMSTLVELKVIPANICDAYGENKTVRHPFECNKYLICRGKYFEIHECDNGVCYDQDSEKCGQTSLEMKDVVAYLNEGVASLKCHLTHTGAWNKIIISKADPGHGTIMGIVSVRRGHEPIIHNTTMKDRLFANIEIETRYEVELNVWLYILTCEDQGEYFCEVDAPFKLTAAKGGIDIRVKPTAPSLSIPSAIVEGLPINFNFTCEADVGFPHGQLFVKTKLQNETDFKDLWFQDEVIEEETNCSKVVKRTFQFIPSMVHNGMTIMCEVQNPATLPQGHTMVTTHDIHIVPGNFCKTHADSTAHVHPYDCHQYVQCSEDYIYVQRCGSDHCFDPETLRCDLPDLQNKHTFDPNYPCRPNQNGVFFHHPFLCNKYIWCVQGEEIVQHCPIGTLYIDSGQCTFDVDQSRCYKTKDQTSIT